METCLQALLTAADGVQLVEQPNPGDPGPGELLVAMRLAPINPADRLMIAGRYRFQPSEPSVIGAEGVGEVIAVGGGIADFRIGDRVIPLARGNWTSVRRMPADMVVPVPDALPLEQAAMLRINPATAWRLLATVPLAAGDVVIQNGGRSAVARLVEQIAGERGIMVLTVSRHAGVSAPMLHDAPGLADHARVVAAGRPIRLALDCVAGGATGRLADCLDDRGHLTVFGHLSAEPCHIASTLLTGRGLTVSGFSLRPAEAGDGIVELRRLYARIATLLCDRPLPVAATIPLSRLGDALARAVAGGGGRVLLDLQR